MLEKGLKRVAILDFGGQYAHLIARRVRNLGVLSELFAPGSFKPEERPDYVGVILSGGPDSMADADHARLEAGKLGFDLRTVKIPVLGLCYGHHLIASAMGGKVVSGKAREYGLMQVQCSPEGRLFQGLSPTQKVWMSHGDHVEELPAGFRITASSEHLRVAAFESEDQRLFGLQFHPEVSHTEHGNAMLQSFLSVCKAERSWNPRGMADSIMARVREQAEGKKLFLLLSGGVDSLVALALCVRAVGAERVFSLHVDTGLMRKGESAEVMDYLKGLGFKNLSIASAEQIFLERLEGVIDPERKRALIGALFVEVLHQEIGKLPLGEDWMLVQGTIYPDTIESGGTERAARIKTHHNRVAEIEKMIEAGKVIEPLSDLYKDEVRALGKQLGLPANLVGRHPFPGPGLGIRVLCSDGRVPNGFDADAARANEIIASSGLRATVLPVHSVGVQGDSRTYRHPAVLWKPDGSWPGWETLKLATAGIVNRMRSINRTLWSVEPIHPGDLELRPCLLEKAKLDLLREVDALVRRETARFDEVWQIPVVALPLFDKRGRQAFVVRPVCSQDAMTADPFEMEDAVWRTIAEKAQQIAGVGAVLYDLTTKPPATIEWE